MKIDIKKIAKLSFLEIEEDKIEKYEKDMKEIIELANNFPDLELNNTYNEIPMKLREDKSITDKFTQEELFSNAPEIAFNCFSVPKTVW